MSSCSDSDALQRFETIWGSVECGISIIDAETREILDINPVAARMFGDDKEKIIGKRCHNFICPAEENSCLIMDKNQVVDRSERKFIRANGETLPIVKSVAKIRYNGRLALLESFTDISNLKEAEEKLRLLSITEQANRAKSDFLSRMSHEMRTPMNAIIGMTKIAESTEDVSKLKYCLSTIGVSSTHLLGIINDILDMSKIEAGKLELDSTPLNLEAMLTKICNLTSEEAGHKGISLAVALDPAMPMDYTGDEQRLSQVITNLMSNAVKFTPKDGTIRLAVEEKERGEETAVLRFTVSDTGIGMTEEQMGRLFNAFEQADTSISRRFGGTGLGLAISRSIVEKMNGSINVTSEPGQGSVFTVDVELLRRPPRKDASAPLGGRNPASVSVLVIAADQETRAQFLAIAGHAGVSTQAAEDAATGIRLASQAADAGTPFHAVFLDLDLPEDKGMALARELTARSGGASLILMASFVKWNAVDDEAQHAGVTRFVSKPLFPSAVLDALSESLGGTSQETASGTVRTTPDFSRISLLLVEDVAINREIFHALLESTGIRMDSAENGLEAVIMFNDNPDKYDLIVMDVQMPTMDGYEATAVIRGLESPRARTVPIIAMTANAFREDIDKCLACGMNDHLSKPIDEKVVMEKIAQFCGG